MSYLLDTHAFVWLVQAGGPRIPGHVEAAVTAADRLCVSAVSALEVATKVRIGKLPGAEDLVDRWSTVRRRIGAETVPIREEHALLAGTLDWDHRDPFDRILVAQALTDGLTVITADGTVLGAPGVSALPW